MTDTLPSTHVPLPDKTWLSTLHDWRARRVASLANGYGWWSITSLVWLEEGVSVVGSNSGAQVRLAERFPSTVATLTLAGDSLTLAYAPGTALTVKGRPLTGPVSVEGDQAFSLDGETPVRVNIVRRGDMWGVRVYDPRAAADKDPDTDVAWFDPAPEWVIGAELIEAEPSEVVPVSNVIGQVSMQPVAARVRFRRGDAEHTLLATHAGGGRLFINFRDASNEDYDRPASAPVTYSGGRFLITEPPERGRVTLDFNRAHHPPCAHTPYATCPVPTADNQLPFPVMAGERVARH